MLTLSSLATGLSNSKPTMQRVLALEGNIGAGKSTLLKLLGSRGFKIVEEPVEKWQQVVDEEGSNLLDKFYRDPKRWAFTFQTYAFISRTEAAVNELRSVGTASSRGGSSTSYVFERSLHSDKHCFATNCFKTGLFDAAEWKVYCSYWAWVVKENPCLDIDGFVYLRTSPETCLRRSMTRGRAEEESLPLDYLEQLHARHEEWLVAPPAQQESAGSTGGEDLSTGLTSDGTPVLVIDCDKEFENDEHRLQCIGKAIDRFCDDLQPRDCTA